MALRRLAAGVAAVAGAGALYGYDHVSQQVSETSVPRGSLLAAVAIEQGHKDVYVDAYEATVYAPLASGSTVDKAADAENEAALLLHARSFFSSAAFWPEKKLLQLLGRPRSGIGSSTSQAVDATPSTSTAGSAEHGSDQQQPAFRPGDSVASGRFAVTARRPQEVLLEWELGPSLQGATWLAVARPTPFKYQLYLGSGVWGENYEPAPQSLKFKAHRLYSKVLLYASKRAFERALMDNPTGALAAVQH